MNDSTISLTSSSAAALQLFFASGIVMVSVLLCGLNGFRVKLFRSILAFGSLVTGAVAAFVWCEGAGRFLGAFGIPEAWLLLAGYTLVLCVVVVVMRLVLRMCVRADVMTYVLAADRAGGVLVGVVAGMFLASVIRVGFAMAPFPAAARPTPEQLELDMTPRFLRMMAKILSSDDAVRKQWLYGAAETGDVQPGQIAISEPYVDLNSNGQRDGNEPFLDKNGDGEFTKAISSVDPTGVKIGVMDRYWLGDWQRVAVSELGGD